MMNFYGMPVYENIYLVKTYQFRFPRCKSRRIRNKWRKDSRNFRSEPDPGVYVANGNIFGHPATIARIREALKCHN